jgi:hypothetical protein
MAGDVAILSLAVALRAVSFHVERSRTRARGKQRNRED